MNKPDVGRCVSKHTRTPMPPTPCQGHRNTNPVCSIRLPGFQPYCYIQAKVNDLPGLSAAGARAEKVLPMCRTSTFSGGVLGFSLSGTPMTKSALSSLTAASAAFHSLHNISKTYFSPVAWWCAEKDTPYC